MDNVTFALVAAAEHGAVASLDAHGEFVSATQVLNFLQTMHDDGELGIEGFPDEWNPTLEAEFARHYHQAAENLSRSRGIL